MNPCPKPQPRVKEPKVLRRSGRQARRSPLLHPEWRKLRNEVMKDAGGFCQIDDCNALAVEVHHKLYGPKGTWRRLIVEKQHLVAVCRPHHQAFHPEKQR